MVFWVHIKLLCLKAFIPTKNVWAISPERRGWQIKEDNTESRCVWIEYLIFATQKISYLFLYLPSGIFSVLPRNCKVHNNHFLFPKDELIIYILPGAILHSNCAYFLRKECLKKQIKLHCSGTVCKKSGSVHVTKEHHESEKYCLAISFCFVDMLMCIQNIN